MDINNLLCSQNESLYCVLDIINQNAKGIVFVVDDEQRLIGTLSDGDIRRAMLAKCSLATVAKDLLDKDSAVFKRIINYFNKAETKQKLQQASIAAPVGTSIERLMQLVNKRIKIIPLLDNKGRVVDYFEYKSSFHAPVASPFVQGNELNYIAECLETNWVSSQGRFVKEFEAKFPCYCGAEFGVAVSSGTTALHLALEALGLGSGDEIILPDLTFAATINAVLHSRATPVIVDVEEDSWCIDPLCIKMAITPKTKAILPVHLYGQPANMNEILKIAEEYNLFVIEDCAEAMGAVVGGKRVGSHGDIGCFSFFGNKIVTTGEGGMCITSNYETYQRMICLRDHGMSRQRKYWHETVGYNYRMTNIQAAIGVAQLEQIDRIQQRRRNIASSYSQNLKDCPFLIDQPQLIGRGAVTWLVSYLLSDDINRDTLITEAGKSGIDIRPFFYPLSDMPPYRLFAKRYTPIAHDLSARGINLPTSLCLSDDDFDKIAMLLLEIIPLAKIDPLRRAMGA
jgi:perosamine synthetase